MKTPTDLKLTNVTVLL